MPPIIVCLPCNIVLSSYSSIFGLQQISAKLDIFISIYNKQNKRGKKVTFLSIMNAKFMISYSEQLNTHMDTL